MKLYNNVISNSYEYITYIHIYSLSNIPAMRMFLANTGCFLFISRYFVDNFGTFAPKLGVAVDSFNLILVQFSPVV